MKNDAYLTKKNTLFHYIGIFLNETIVFFFETIRFTLEKYFIFKINNKLCAFFLNNIFCKNKKEEEKQNDYLRNERVDIYLLIK